MSLAELKHEALKLSPAEQRELIAFLASIQAAEDDEKPVTSLAKFIRWIVVPIERLRQIRNGDGAFAALNLGFALCERYYRDKSNTESKHWKNKDFKVLAAHDIILLFQLGLLMEQLRSSASTLGSSQIQ